LRDDILQYKKALEKCNSHDDEARSYLMDMGIKALRLVGTFSLFFLQKCVVHYQNVQLGCYWLKCTTCLANLKHFPVLIMNIILIFFAGGISI
jgi:hypothetical protein